MLKDRDSIYIQLVNCWVSLLIRMRMKQLLKFKRQGCYNAVS